MKKRLTINLNKKSTVELPKVSSGSLIVGVYEGPFTKELKKIDEVSKIRSRKLPSCSNGDSCPKNLFSGLW